MRCISNLVRFEEFLDYYYRATKVGNFQNGGWGVEGGSHFFPPVEPPLYDHCKMMHAMASLIPRPSIFHGCL